MKEILIKLNQRPIAVYPIYIKIIGGSHGTGFIEDRNEVKQIGEKN